MLSSAHEATSLTAFLQQFPRDAEMTRGRVREWRVTPDQVTCVVDVPAWWEPAVAAGGPESRGRVELTCLAVVGAEIRGGWYGAEVEVLAEHFDHPALWAFGPAAALYSAAPLPDPDAFLAEFDDLLRHRLGVPGDPADFRGDEPRAEWAARVRLAQLHHVLSAPQPVAEAARALLEARGVNCDIVRSSPTARPRVRRRHRLRAVLVGESWVACHGTAVRATLVTA